MQSPVVRSDAPSPSMDARLDRRDRRGEAGAFSATSAEGMVAAAHYRAADAGRAMLERGGNAADAAVAAAYALGVCEPAASGLGGMAMAVVHRSSTGSVRMLEGACRAPGEATAAEVKASHRYRGHRAVAVPTAPALLDHLHARYGKLSHAQVLQPAIALAREGVAVTPLQHMLVGKYAGALREHGAGAVYLDGQGRPWPVGHVLKHPDLAETLEQLARGGAEAFYTGDIGRRMCEDIRRNGGFVTEQDLAEVPWPRECEPIVVPFGDCALHTAGPPAGGVALAQLAQMWTALGSSPDPDTPEGAVWIAAMIQRARRDRRHFSQEIGNRSLAGAAELISERHAAGAIQGIGPGAAGGETTHVSAMDGEVAVALTLSIERSFGSACIADGLGFLYNGYLRGFKVEATSHPHYLRPGAPARSNAAPTLLMDASGARAAIGSTGSERMVSSIFTTLTRLARQSPFEAVVAPRMHCTPEGQLLIEQQAVEPAVLEALGARFQLDDVGPWSFRMGGLQLVTRSEGGWTGVADPRRDGDAAGPG